MAFQVPSSLIREVQITLRKEAEVSAYDLDYPSFPDLPSLDEAIAGFDPSPSYLRCKQCQGRLLRGLQSMVCVYCGAHQKREISPIPISFNTTFGYRMLLESLDLNGSEDVGLAAGENDSTKDQTLKDALVLSDLLDLELNWPAQLEKVGFAIASEAAVQTKSSLKLAGVDLDNFFSEAKEETVLGVPAEQLVPNQNTNSVESRANKGSSRLPESADSREMAVRSVTSEGSVRDHFASWEPQFESASSGTLPMDSKSFEPFQVSSETDLSSMIDTAFGHGKLTNDSVPLTSMTNDWNQDDLWHASNNSMFNKTEQFKTNINANNEPIVISSHPAATSNNWIEDDLWKTSTVKASNSEKINDDVDSFDVWQDFTSSQNAPELLSISLEQIGTRSLLSNEQLGIAKPTIEASDEVERKDISTNLLQTSCGKASNSEKINEDNNLFNVWQDFTASENVPEPLLNSWDPTDARTSASAEQEPNLMSLTKTNPEANDEPKGISSTLASTSGNWIQGDLWKTSATTASNTEKTYEDDSFDVWQDFTSSKNISDPLSNPWEHTGSRTSPSGEQVSNKLSLTNDLHIVELGRFSQPDLFPVAPSLQNGSTDVNMQLEISASDRVAGKKIKTGGDTERQGTGDETATSDLISQMHDLSFMLESKLSIPKRV